MKPNMSSFVLFFFLELLAIATNNMSFCNGGTYVGCIESERQALLRFKQGLRDPANRLASWSSTGDKDCCAWTGVVCNNLTGHVLELHLGNPHSNYQSPSLFDAEYVAYKRSKLWGEINPSLFDISNLVYLNLYGNAFEGMIPQQLGNLSNLQRLNLGMNLFLYANNFGWLSGLSSLEYLNLNSVGFKNVSDWLLVINILPSLVVLQLSGCQLQRIPPLSFTNFSSLSILDLSGNQFDDPLVPKWIFSLSRLVFLDLSFNRFQGPIPDGFQNFTSLRYLGLYQNHFNSSIPNWLFRLSHLEYLDLGWNRLEGILSSDLGNLTSIKSLDLTLNKLEGKIPRSFGRLCKAKSISLSGLELSQEISEVLDILSGCVSDGIEFLGLDNNQFLGHLNDQLGQFKNLDTLFLGWNSISGSIPSSLGKLLSLRSLELQHNKLDGPIPFSIGELSLLDILDLSSNRLIGPIPYSFGKLQSLRILYLSTNKLNGTLSEVHFANLTRLKSFYASGNSLKFEVGPNWMPPFQLESFYASFCQLGPQFPLWFHTQRNLAYLELSNSGISDIVPSSFWNSSFQFKYLNLSQNEIHGEIPNLTGAVLLYSLDLSSNNLSGPLPLLPSSVYTLDLSQNALSGSTFQFLCNGKNESKKMQILNLGDNFLFGELPDCWMNWQNLLVLNLGNNRFTGDLPTSMGILSSLQSLHLHRNSLSGTMLASLKNCTKLLLLDASENKFSGIFPPWIGERFPSLMILNLRSNKFYGFLPLEVCSLASLQILDLAYNNLSGAIPRCINNISAMVTMNSSMSNNIQYSTNYSVVIEDAVLVLKGKSSQYSSILNLVRTVDLSENIFSGEIPIEVTNLKALQSMNLSHNLFTGKILEKIGDMISLESIDFSWNQLSGEIPQSMSSLTFLNHLNLSYNNLTGKIPLGTQLQSFDASCFIGNELCGSPLPTNCTETSLTPDHENGRGKDGDEHVVVEEMYFYISMALGFVVGFWGFIGPLLVNRRWRYRYCYFLDSLGSRFPYIIAKYF